MFVKSEVRLILNYQAVLSTSIFTPIYLRYKLKKLSDRIHHLFTHIIRLTLKKYFAFVAILIVIVFTFTSKENNQPTNSSTHPLVTVQCKNTSIPSFTLNYDSNPSEDEVKKLCACIWDKFSEWEKETAVKLTRGETNTISAVHMVGFPAIFGKRISECGGDKL